MKTVPDNVTCKHCGTLIGDFCIETYMKPYKNYDEDHNRKCFCSEECYNDYKKQFKIEVYKGNTIYCFDVDGEKRYVPYFSAAYYFTTLEDCKKRIDARNITVMP